uniref:G-protein coupled receptors family 1 profile domain-containing protein n=1 Tax=Pyxicephalus adspersus TaxID=30357 RepID=A0AAV2ZJJ0_PYXAD|nr:TPA: hypothetical protein GDO54_005186 [Pyxicephalus adspersus]
MELLNQSLFTQFIIVGLPNLGKYETLLFLFPSISYIFTLSGNLTILTLICTYCQLHVPFYSFVAVLSFLEIWYTPVTIPKNVDKLETYILTAMAFDLYMPICNLLRYPSIMTVACSFHLAAFCWVIGFIRPLTQVILLSPFLFCHSNIVEQIVCDFTPLIILACSDISPNVKVDFLFFYFFGSVCFMYVRPIKITSANYDHVMAVIYSVLTPMCNPEINSLRNPEIRRVLRRKLAKLF